MKNRVEIEQCKKDIIKYFKKNKGYKNAILGTSTNSKVKTLENEIGWNYKYISRAIKDLNCSDVSILNVKNIGYFMPNMRLKSDRQVVEKI